MPPLRRLFFSQLSQHRGLIFLGCIVLAFVQAGLFVGRRASLANLEATSDIDVSSRNDWLFPSSTGVKAEHPISKLMADAEVNFRRLLSKQSRSLRAAVREYKRRYKRDPPKGFDRWWKFAKDNDVKIIDEYDGLIEDLAPFWEISAEELRRRAMQAGYLPAIDLVQIRNGTASAVNIHPGTPSNQVSSRAVGFRRMMKKFQHTLPDMDMPINALAEGRVLVSWDQRQYPNTTPQNFSETFDEFWQNDGNVWEAYRRTCPPSSPARKFFSSIRNASIHQSVDYLYESDGLGNEFAFVKDTGRNSNFCNKPWAHYMQGHFFSDYRTISSIYPVFSPAKADGYLDVRIPSHYYFGSTPRYTYGWDAVNLELKGFEAMEVPWEHKMDKIFWRGASTGGGNNPPLFSDQYQRHRFLKMTSDESDLNYMVTFADPPDSSRFVSVNVPIRSLNDEIMDVAFVKLVDEKAHRGGLEAMMANYRLDHAVTLGEHWAYKYLIDFDGKSYSGRFMAFMASDSAVMKATVYREYFSDWIQPWLHFIPLSSSYIEIYNIHAFFSGVTRSTLVAANSTVLNLPQEKQRSKHGDRRLRRIARAGKQWKNTIGRTIDMEAYVYRLCLEYARLWADDRQSMSFTY